MLSKKIKFIKLKRFLIPKLAYHVINFLDKTTKVVNYNQPVDIKTPIIYAIWHGRQYCLLKVEPRNKLNVLVSKSNDGEIIATILARLGYNLIRGSASRGGYEAVKQIFKAIKSGENIAFTVDGPRGPIYSINPSLFKIAKSYGATIVPLVPSLKYKFIVNSWDKYNLPLFFTTFYLYYGKPFEIKKGIDDNELQELISNFETEMNMLTIKADQRTVGNNH